MGRRLTKKFTYHNGANTDVTTYKYHYIGGQITEIEIDAIRNPGEGQTVLRNEEVKIHLGANSQPISYEWVKHVGESTTSATYYYHYDIHGNVLKVTDSSENVKITYTYDVLGKILTESNPDSILNFFTFRGASQTIWDSEVGMYYSGGYYRPDTGTALQGTGAPVLTNPATGSMLKAMAKVNQANMQLKVHAIQAVSTAGSSSGGAPGGFSPPAGPSDGIAHSGKNKPSRPPDPTPPPNDYKNLKIANLRTPKGGGGTRTIESVSSDPMNPIKPGTTTVCTELEDESGDSGSDITSVTVLTPITEETDASQLQPEQSDETFEAVYVWDKPGEKGSSQAVNAVDTGVPGGGGEMRLMGFIDDWVWRIIEGGGGGPGSGGGIGAGAVALIFVYIIEQLIEAGLDTLFNILNRVFKEPIDMAYAYNDTLNSYRKKYDFLKNMSPKEFNEYSRKLQLLLGPFMNDLKEWYDLGSRANSWTDVMKTLTGLAIEYDKVNGAGAAARNPGAFRKWAKRRLIEMGLIKERVGPKGSNDYPIEIQPKPIIPFATETSFYKIREIHKEKVQA